jgi:membrane dipeptidase
LRPAGDPPALLERARAIHGRVLTLDTHVDIDPAHFQAGGANYVSGVASNQVDLPKMEQGGLDAAFFSIYQGQEPDFTAEGYRRAHDTAMAKIEAVYRLTSDLAPARIGLARTVADMRRLQAEGRMIALMGMENGYALGEDLGNVKKFADLGVRYLSLAHNGHSQLADSNTGEREGYRWNGLSPLGRQVVAEANRWGIVLDISHPSKAANLETIKLSRAPVMASHSSVRAVAEHSRNLDDEELRAVQANGGVVHVTAFPEYLKADPPERRTALATLADEFGLPASGRSRIETALAALLPERRGEYERRQKEIQTRYPAAPPATVSDLVDHIEYVVKLIGIDHVGISSDFDGGGGIDGWNNAAETFTVTMELVRRGYTEAEIARIWSGNLMRVLGEVEQVAAALQQGR